MSIPIPTSAGLALPATPPTGAKAAGLSTAGSHSSASTQAGAIAEAAPATGNSVPIGPTPVAPSASISSPVQWSAQALQGLRLQAFENLIAQLALQIQSPGQTQRWPAQGVPPALQQWLQNLLASIQLPGQPLQILAAQPGSAALMQALTQATTPAASTTSTAAAPQAASGAQLPTSPLQTAAPMSPASTAALLQAGTVSSASAAMPATANNMPPLQNWWVQQGTVSTTQGERGFSMILQAPSAWAQAANTAPGAATPAAPLQLHWGSQAPLPTSGPIALVLQSQVAGVQQRTSALLWLEFQPLAPSAQITQSQTAGLPTAMLTPLLMQEVQQLLQNKADPWLQMAAAQAANALPKERQPMGEHRSHFCTTEGCQYEGRAPCAQPFCSEMNRIWAVARLERSR